MNLAAVQKLSYIQRLSLSLGLVTTEEEPWAVDFPVQLQGQLKQRVAGESQCCKELYATIGANSGFPQWLWGEPKHASEQVRKLYWRHKHNCFAVQTFICISLLLKFSMDWFLKHFQNLLLFASFILLVMRWWLENEVHHPAREVSRGSPSQQLVHPRACFWRQECEGMPTQLLCFTP